MMFTGIIEEIGTVQAIQRGAHSAKITIFGDTIFSELHCGDSIAVNGVCLTAAALEKKTFTADIMQETLCRSSLGALQVGCHINLERAMAANGRFGGHIVSGHIDGTGKITAIARDGNAVWYTIAAAPPIMRFLIEKGSIAIDGISLTVASVSTGYFCISVIPHTAKNTILSEKKVGDLVNLENDVIGKYAEKLLRPIEALKQEDRLTEDFLKQCGY